MALPIITTAPPMASFDRPAQWDQEMMTFLEWMQALPPELNALIPYLLAAAGPNGIAGTVRFSTTTTAADPGSGHIRLNNATQASATAAYLDLIDANGIDVTALLARIGQGTSTIKGEFKLSLAGDPTKWLSFELTSAASPTGYRSFVLQNGVGSASSPFSAEDVLTWSYTRTGDKGDPGVALPWQNVLSNVNISGSPSTITVSALPTIFATIGFDFDNVSLSGNDNITVAVSSDGSTFSTPVSVTAGGGTSNYSGRIELPDYLNPGLSPIICRLGQTPGAAPAVSAIAASNVNLTRRTAAAVQAVRFGTATATTFSSGVIRPRAV